MQIPKTTVGKVIGAPNHLSHTRSSGWVQLRNSLEEALAGVFLGILSCLVVTLGCHHQIPIMVIS